MLNFINLLSNCLREKVLGFIREDLCLNFFFWSECFCCFFILGISYSFYSVQLSLVRQFFVRVLVVSQFFYCYSSRYLFLRMFITGFVFCRRFFISQISFRNLSLFIQFCFFMVNQMEFFGQGGMVCVQYGFFFFSSFS